MKGLKLTERLHNIGDIGKFHSIFDKKTLRLEVLLEIKVSQLLVHLQMVVELLAHCLELFPDFCLGRRRPSLMARKSC